MPRFRISEYAVLAILLTTSTSALSPALIFARQDTCGGTGYNRCVNAGLPANFCCPTTSVCLPLAGNTTVLCCPSTQDCSQIRPIICDITAQDALKNPDATLKTTALAVPMVKCGAACCPHGFSCNDQQLCAKNTDQNQKPIALPQQGTSSSTPSPSTPIPTPTRSSSSNPAPQSSVTTTTSNESPTPTSLPLSPSATTTISKESPTFTSLPSSPSDTLQPTNAFPAPAILAGFFPGLLLGIALVIAFICLTGERRKRKAAHQTQNTQKRHSGSSFGNISEPQLQSDIRSDFLRKGTAAAPGVPSRSPTMHRVRSFFRRSQGPNAGMGELADYQQRDSAIGGSGGNNTWGGGGGAQLQPIPLNIQHQHSKNQSGKNIRPVTPPLQREPSLSGYGNIDIFTDGDTASALRRNAAAGDHNSVNRNGNGNNLALPPRIGSNDYGGGGGGNKRDTSFSDILQRSGLAGLQKGQPFVYKANTSPGYHTPPRGGGV